MIEIQNETSSKALNLPVQVEDWGLIDYEEALHLQERRAQELQKNLIPGFLVFCSHPPVVTLGRKTEEGDLTTWTGPIISIARGGRATYHGPNQLIAYPILNLTFFNKDLGWLLRTLERVSIQTLGDFGVSASTRAGQTGVWIGERKIASIGLGVKSWVSQHGIALNLFYDPSDFKGLRPCGLESSVMISLEELIDRRDIQNFSQSWRSSLEKEIQSKLW
ncbi:MAG: lipoyl(octanoyl) transferase LipB [Bdellovibrio sp.]